MRHSAYRMAGRIFYLDTDTAARVDALRSTDPAAALALADRVSRSPMPNGSTISFSMNLLDSARTDDMTANTVLDAASVYSMVDGLAKRHAVPPEQVPAIIADAFGRYSDRARELAIKARFDNHIKARGA